jgi:sugar lactone lactonase YvrE
MNRFSAIFLCIAGLLASGSATAGSVKTLAAIPANGGIAIDSTGDLYAAHFGVPGAPQGPRNVWKLSPTNAFAPFVFATGIIVGSGNAFDAQDILFQSNFGGNRISRIDQAGNVTTFNSNVFGPIGIVIDDGGTLTVANCNANTLSRITPQGVATQFSASAVYSCPNGMTSDSAGNLYVINFNDGRIFSVSQNGTPTLFAQVTSPGGHLAIAKGRLYATSFGGHQVIGFELSGPNAGNPVVTIGRGVAVTADGTFASAGFNSPNGIAADEAGEHLYVTEAGGIRDIALEGDLTFTSIATSSTVDLTISADTCTGTSLATSENCSVTVTFAPQAAGDLAESLDIVSNDPGGTVNVLLTSSVQEVPAPRIVVTDEIDFGGLMVGEEGQRGLRIRNQGTLPLNIAGIDLSEETGSKIRMMAPGLQRPMIQGPQNETSSENFTATRKCVVIEAGEGCTETLRFHPQDAGLKSAVLGIDSDDPLAPRLVVVLKATASEDSDGIPDAVEDGAANTGDGNTDGTADRSQPDVGSLPDGGGVYQTLVSVDALPLADVNSVTHPSPQDAPAGVTFDQGFLSFSVTGVPATAVTMTLTLDATAAPAQFFNYGAEPGNTADHWYDFAFDGTSGAQITGNVVTLTLVDGARGDADLTANGTIAVLGGAATTPPPPPPPAPTPTPTGGGGGGGGGAMGWLLIFGLLPGIRRYCSVVAPRTKAK